MIGCNHNDFSIVGDITVINKNIKLGHNVTIYPDVMLFGDGEIVIGDNVDIGNGTIIYSSKDGGVTIGNDTMIAGQCYIIDMDHGIRAESLFVANIIRLNRLQSATIVGLLPDVKC